MKVLGQALPSPGRKDVRVPDRMGIKVVTFKHLFILWYVKRAMKPAVSGPGLKSPGLSINVGASPNLLN